MPASKDKKPFTTTQRAKPAKKQEPDVQAQIDRIQKRARDLESWQDEVEQALAQGLNILVGNKREAQEAAAEEEQA